MLQSAHTGKCHSNNTSINGILFLQLFPFQFIREKVSTSTVLLIARTAKNLRRLYVRRFAVIIRCDWPRHPEWTDEFYIWLRHTSRSYEAVEREVSQILGYKWNFLSDHDYKQLQVDVRKEY